LLAVSVPSVHYTDNQNAFQPVGANPAILVGNAGVSSVTLSVCAKAELVSAPMNAALSARARTLLRNFCLVLIESLPCPKRDEPKFIDRSA
jgi:hypothetical protein